MKKISSRLIPLLFFVAFGMPFLTMAKPAFAHHGFEAPSYEGPSNEGDEDGPSDEGPGVRSVSVPEFDPAALTSGLALCVGGSLMLLERIRRRR
jgi:hypothetical protein